MIQNEAWNGFKGKLWRDEVNVRDFIQNNYTPYEGDSSFLEAPTEATEKLWKELQKLQKEEHAKNGVLDTKSYGDIANRSWVFRTMGYGHDIGVWKDIISMLNTVGYDDVISIEHEDALMSAEEGLQKAIAFLKDVLIFENAGEMWWA